MSNSIKDSAQAFAVNQVLKYVDSNPQEAFPKLLDWADKFDKDNLYLTQRQQIRKVMEQPDSNWMRLINSLWTDIDSEVRKVFFRNFIVNASLLGSRKQVANREKYGCNIPWAILMDPTSACNLHCTGCWAAEYGNKLNLSYEELDDIINQANELGTYMFLYTGGEPMVRKNDLLRLCEAHPDCVFSAFTNGTLIDEKFADEMLRVKNFVPAISVEGFEAATDGRRGEGTFGKVTHAFKLLREHGLPFGVSCCYTSANAGSIASEDFFDWMIDQGVLFAWIFTYFPVGVDAPTDLMVTPGQREHLYRFVRKMRQEKPLFTLDFQNDGEFVGGCIAGGRVFCHVNARGDVEPCVFIHYSNANIHEKSWLECLQQPIFQEYRANWPWNDNMLRPCPMLENPQVLPKMVHDADAKSTEYTSPEDVDHLCARTAKYAEKWAPEGDRIWVEEHPTGKKVYEDNISMMDVDKKAKMLAEKDAELDSHIEEELKEEKETVGAAK